MTGRCEEFDGVMGAGRDGVDEAAWREHLDSCTSCREQEATDALLRAALPPAPQIPAGFEERLHRGLRRELERQPAPARRPSAMRPAALWALGAYGTAAAVVSALLLARLPWQSVSAPPELFMVLGALALLSPMVLLDRVGVMRPPG